jgi:8-oxo-dGTP diphosphatase|tara:strand:+ start:453 stop:851 length:399 start_codon:yes stop_codon:yes gene_type:complete
LKKIDVAAGILIDKNNRVLITQRIEGKLLKGFWEFPGGKLNIGENPEIALKRELEEELGISVISYEPFMQLEHCYYNQAVNIDFFLVHKWLGSIVGLDGQNIQWVKISRLPKKKLLEADIPIIKALQEICHS